MPTTVFKNTLYRMALPFCAPGVGRKPVSGLSGHGLCFEESYIHLIRKHHVLGSSTYLSSGNHSTMILTASKSPDHRPLPDTFFRVASITKTATSALVMRLSDLGKLDIDIPVSELFVSDKEQKALKGIKLRHLLSHTAGIIDPPNLEYSVENGVPFCDVLSAARQYNPGTGFHYSNLGFGLIGCILEQVLQLPVSTVFDQYLFSPLDMNASLEGCSIPCDKIMPVTRILPYRKGRDVIVTRLGSFRLTEPDPLRHYGHTAGSMYTDILSLYKLIHMLSADDNQFISYASLNDMKAMHASYGKLSPTLSYGLGLLRISDPYISDSIVYGHQGFAYGCADGAFWDDSTKQILITLNGGCSEARTGRLGAANRDFLHWAFRKELPSWSE
ncbi:MAG: serine hydrolase [Clostridia bacterium]|nr:serine hydrolase [Clostridia bacterium]